MNYERSKTFVNWALIISLLLVGFSSLAYVRSYSRSIEPSSFRSFSVTGEGRVVLPPDIAKFTFAVISEGGVDIASLEKDNTERGNRINSFLKEKGIETKDIKTEDYNISPRYQSTFCGPNYISNGRTKVCPPPSIVGYTIRQSVSVKIRNFDKIGEILSGVAERGANDLSQLNFTIDNPVMVENEARAKAIAEAKIKAGVVAKAGGFSVGRLLGIDEGGYQPFYSDKYARTASLEGYGMGGDIAVPAPTIEPGSQEVVINVTLRYEIE